MHLKTLIVAVAAALALPGAALAQHGGMGRGGGAPPGMHGGGHFAAGPVGRFGAHDMATWRAGNWWHGWRGGRVGWWWFAGGFWYWYASPIYPYPAYVPDYYLGGGYYPAPGSVWWFCDNPPGYYPYVQGCWRWRPVAPSASTLYPPG
jgi:hypothetical protein